MPEPDAQTPDDAGARIPSRTNPGSPDLKSGDETGSSSQPDGPAPEELRRAMKAFKKRLKLTRLDDESGLGHGPMTGGRSSGVVAIMPPNQYPRAVWDALVERGRLKYAGQGLYQMADS